MYVLRGSDPPRYFDAVEVEPPNPNYSADCQWFLMTEQGEDKPAPFIIEKSDFFWYIETDE